MIPAVKIFRPIDPVRADVIPGFSEGGRAVYTKQSASRFFSVGRYRFGLFRPCELQLVPIDNVQTKTQKTVFKRRGFVCRELSTGALCVIPPGRYDAEKALAVSLNRVLRGVPQLDQVVSEFMARNPTDGPLNSNLPGRTWARYTEHNFNDPKEAYDIGGIDWSLRLCKDERPTR